MEPILVSDLRKTQLPERLPANSRLKVWVRSTGYEVHFPEQQNPGSPLLWLLLIAGLSGLAYLAYQSGSLPARYDAIVFIFPVSAVGLLIYRKLVPGYSRVRLDITPMTIVISYLGAGNQRVSQQHVPIKEIESFYISPSSGLALNSTISEILYRTWIGRGLSAEDLQYLARLIVESSKLSMQSPHPGSG